MSKFCLLFDSPLLSLEIFRHHFLNRLLGPRGRKDLIEILDSRGCGYSEIQSKYAGCVTGKVYGDAVVECGQRVQAKNDGMSFKHEIVSRL